MKGFDFAGKRLLLKCIARASAAGDAAIIPVIERMAAQLEPPGDDEVRW